MFAMGFLQLAGVRETYVRICVCTSGRFICDGHTLLYIFFYLSILLAVRLPTYSDIQDISLLDGSEFQSELVYRQ